MGNAYVADVGSLNPVYETIFSQKPSINVLVYSGGTHAAGHRPCFFAHAQMGADVDILTVAYQKTQQCLWNIAQQTSASSTRVWGPWTVNGYTAGYWEQNNLFTYATVKGAGHEAPQYVAALVLRLLLLTPPPTRYQPLSSLAMIERFVATQSLVDPLAAPPRNVPVRPMRQGDVLRRFEERMLRK